MSLRDWRFPTTCPACNQIAAFPYRVTSEATTLELGIKCGHCGHQWILAAEAPPLLLKPKEDRRSSSRG